jgi:hypothetical protein
LPRGGRRAGAGRKSHETLARQLAIEAAAKLRAAGTGLVLPEGDLGVLLAEKQDALLRKIIAEQDRLLNAMVDLATGTYCKEFVEVVGPETGEAIGTEERVYLEKPDRQAAAWLLEIAHGKATQKVEQKSDTRIEVFHHIPRPGDSVHEGGVEEAEFSVEGVVPALPDGLTPDDPQLNPLFQEVLAARGMDVQSVANPNLWEREDEG